MALAPWPEVPQTFLFEYEISLTVAGPKLMMHNFAKLKLGNDHLLSQFSRKSLGNLRLSGLEYTDL